MAVTHCPVDADALGELFEHFVKLIGLRACDGLKRGFVALLVPDLVVIAALAARSNRQNNQVENQPPLQAVLFDHPPIGQELLQISPHRPVAGRLRSAEVDQEYANTAAGSRNDIRAHGLRSSAISLPSFGSVPGATNFTAPFSFVIECKVAATAASSAASNEACSASNVILSCSPARSTTRRRRLSSG